MANEKCESNQLFRKLIYSILHSKPNVQFEYLGSILGPPKETFDAPTANIQSDHMIQLKKNITSLAQMGRTIGAPE